jgi:NhaP-type Na+/H+ or K+/H+ antiporter
MSSRKRLETLIEGESLLNDGTAIVLFTLFYGMLSMPAGSSIEATDVVAQFAWVVSAGFLVGLVLGWIAIYWIGRTFNDPLIEISLSIAVAYLVFYVAEGAMHVSGVVALVTLGILFASVGRTRISPEVAGFLHRFWEVMAHVANTLIFLLVGILIASRVQLDAPKAWVALAVLYLGIMVIRALSVTVLVPILRRIGIGFGKDKAIVLIWGGLRGAVALALALSVVQSDVVDPATANQILFLCAGIVVLTIVINGSTFSRVLAWLGLDRLPAAKQATVDKAERCLRRDMRPVRDNIRQQALLEHADWDAIETIAQRVRMPVSDDDSAPAAAAEAMTTAFQRRILEAERKYYWSQFAAGTLSRNAATALVNATEEALDGEPQIHPRSLDSGISWWPRLLHWLLRHPRLEGLFERVGFSRLCLNYEIYRGFLFAQWESKRHLDRLAPSSHTQHFIAKAIDSNIGEAEARITELREQYPAVAKKLETQIAARQLLNQRRRLIGILTSEGVLDSTQAERMTAAVEREMALLHRAKV